MTSNDWLTDSSQPIGSSFAVGTRVPILMSISRTNKSEKTEEIEKTEKLEKTEKGWRGQGGVRSSRTFDLLFHMIIDINRPIDLRWLLMSGAMFISDDLFFSFEVSPYMSVPVEILVCGNSLWKGSEWYVCASTTWWFLASCCSSGSSEGPTLLMRRSTVWQHLVVISATQLRSTTTNWNLSKPYNFKTYASRTKKKISMVNGRQTQWGESW